MKNKFSLLILVTVLMAGGWGNLKIPLETYYGIGLGTEVKQVIKKYGEPKSKVNKGINEWLKQISGRSYNEYRLIYDKVTFHIISDTEFDEKNKKEVQADTVNGIEISDPKYKTKKGISIGAAKQLLREKYGSPADIGDGTQWCYQYDIVYALIFSIKNGKITKISIFRTYD